MIIVSACLAGIPCRYDGTSCPDSDVVRLYQSGNAIAVCPEELGGLPTKRPPAFFDGGAGNEVLDGTARVVRANGEDVTRCFVLGAQRTLQVARDLGIGEALMKSRSPSCGKGLVHGREGLFEGNGVCTALLVRNGVNVKVLGE